MKTNGNGHKTHEDIYTQTIEATITPRRFVHESKLDTLPPPEYILAPFLPKNSLICLYGQSGVGKSFIALDWSLITAQETSVIYVSPEGFGGLAKRRSAWYQHHKKESGQLHFDPDPLNLMNHADVANFVEAARELSPSLIVLDTLAWCMTGGDENSAKDMQIAISACRYIQKELGCSVLIIHHTGKSGGSERGSSALRGGADMMIEVTNRNDIIELSCSKSKDEAPFETQKLRLVTLETPQGSSCILLPSDKVVEQPNKLSSQETQVLTTLALSIYQTVGARWTRIQQDTEIPQSSLSRVLSSLKNKGFIKQSNKGEPYFITDKGNTVLASKKTS